MDKKAITYTELLKKIEAELLAHPECRKVRVKKIQLLKERVGVANWHLLTDGDLKYLNKCEEKINDYVRNLKKSYDIEPGSRKAA